MNRILRSAQLARIIARSGDDLVYSPGGEAASIAFRAAREDPPGEPSALPHTEVPPEIRLTVARVDPATGAPTFGDRLPAPDEYFKSADGSARFRILAVPPRTALLPHLFICAAS